MAKEMACWQKPMQPSCKLKLTKLSSLAKKRLLRAKGKKGYRTLNANYYYFCINYTFSFSIIKTLKYLKVRLLKSLLRKHPLQWETCRTDIHISYCYGMTAIFTWKHTKFTLYNWFYIWGRYVIFDCFYYVKWKSIFYNKRSSNSHLSLLLWTHWVFLFAQNGIGTYLLH